MAGISIGQVVFVRFPFSDLSNSKLRPALVLASAGKKDWVMSQITSKLYGDSQAVEIMRTDFRDGGLSLNSYIRPFKIFTANEEIMAFQAGRLTDAKMHQVVERICVGFNDYA